MKRLLLNIVNFVVILLIIFFVIFLGVILIYSSNEISAGDFSAKSLTQVFVLALFNAAFLATVIYCVFAIADVTRYRLLNLLVPVVLTTIFVGVSLLFTDRECLSDRITLSDDAGIYFSPGSVMSYRMPLSGAFSEEEFDSEILPKIADEKTKVYIRSKFLYENKSYHLKPHILDYDYHRISDILYSVGYIDDIKYIFDDISRNIIGKAVVIRDGQATFYNNLLVTYTDETLSVSSGEDDLVMTFDRDKLLNNNAAHTPASDIFTDCVRKFAYTFTTPASILSCIIIWFGYILLIMALFSIVMFRNFRFISVVMSCITLLCCYIIHPHLMAISELLSRLPFRSGIFTALIFAGIMSTAAVLLLMLNIFGIKSGVWEHQ